MDIGRRPSRNVYMPNNRATMYTKAQKQLEGQATARAESYGNALQVDGPQMVFWLKRNGAVPCSCQAAPANILYSDIKIESDLDFDSKLPTTKAVPGQRSDSNTSRVYHIEKLAKPSINELFKDNATPLRDKLQGTNVQFPDGSDDIMSSFNEDEEDSISDTLDPFNLLGNKIIQCPVCFGTGFIDSYQPHNGSRIVFDTSNLYMFQCDAADMDESANPTIVTLKAGQSITWITKFPLLWESLLRCSIYHKGQLISPAWYSWTFEIPSVQVSGECATDLDRLQNVDIPALLTLTAHEDFPFTHGEIVLVFAELMRGQIPEIPQAYEDEFEDWQASISVELPIEIGEFVSEGDYFAESKYKRAWKINSVNIRKTMGGTIFAVIADCRALHKFEKLLYQLAIFRNPKIKDTYPGG